MFLGEFSVWENLIYFIFIIYFKGRLLINANYVDHDHIRRSLIWIYIVC